LTGLYAAATLFAAWEATLNVTGIVVVVKNKGNNSIANKICGYLSDFVGHVALMLGTLKMQSKQVHCYLHHLIMRAQRSTFIKLSIGDDQRETHQSRGCSVISFTHGQNDAHRAS